MLLRYFFVPFVLVFFSFQITTGQTFTNNIGGAIPSNNVEICFPVTVSGVGVINTTSFGLEKVIININHLNVGDLEVVLRSPGGTRIPLVTRRGLGGDNFINTCFTSNASTSISAGVAPFSGNFFPETGLGLVNNGQNADSVWNLCIKDVFNSAIAGTLLNYSITFSNNPAPPINPPTVQDCPGAIAICRPIYTETVSYVGIGNVSNEIRAPLTCLGTERNSVWYTFTAQTAGIVSFLITPNVSSEDYDWAVFNLSNAKCSEIFTNPALTVRCNFSGQAGPTGPSGQAGGQFSPTLPVLAGQTFAIIVSHFTNTSNGYTIDFSASTALVFDTSKASITSAIPQNKCGTNQINIGLSENVNCSSIKLSDMSVTGPGGPYTIAGFNSPNCLVNSSYTKSLSINVSPAMTTPGSYQVCINPSAGSLTDLCGNTGVSNCVSFTIDTTIIPVFNPIPAFCQGNISPTLPSISLNLVSGAWTPNTISNVSSGIYTFNANATFCPFPLPLSVTVYPKPVLGNDKTIPICSVQTVNLSSQYDTASRIVRWTLGGFSVPDSTAVSASGVYQIVVVDSNTCRDTALVNVAVKPNTYDTTNTVTCQYQLPYFWNGNSYSTEGQFIDTIANAAGCDSIRTLNLKIGTKSYSSTTIKICQLQLPYTWNTKIYTAAGVYKDSIPNIVGCDSVLTLNLSVGSEIRDTSSVSICQLQLPYLWYGNNFSSAGTYYDTISNASGCDSFLVLILKIQSAMKDSSTLVLCQNSLPFTWHGINLVAPGVYKDTLKTVFGCDSIPILNLIVLSNSSSNNSFSICQKQLPFLWNGNMLNSSGTYIDTILNVAGCDSIMNLTLTIKLNSTSTTNVSICSKQLPYFWNGNSYTSSVIYKDTIPNAAGCDSVITLNLIVKANTASTSNAIVCSNKLPYAWNGKNYSTSGIHKDSIPNAAGCDSIMTLNLSVQQISFSTTNISICSKQLPYSWNGNIYTSAGSYNDTLPNASGCDSTLTLNLIVKQNSFSNTIVTICNKQLPFFWNGNNYYLAGTYKDTLPNAIGCDSILTLNLTIIGNSTSTTNVTICSRQLPYFWNGNSYNSSDIYKDTIPNVAGCDSIVTLILVIKSNSSSATTISICPGQLPYLWNGKTYIAGGIYYDTIVNIAVCDSIISINLVIKATTYNTENKTICPRLLPFIWNGNSYYTGGIFKITKLNSQGCDSIITLNLVVKQNTASTTNITVCPKQLPIFWNGKSYNTQGTFNDTMNNAIGCDSILTLNLNLEINTFSISSANICPSQLPYTWNGKAYSVAGTYRDTITNAAGCDSLMTLQLIVRGNSTSTSTINICPEQLPYLWNGKLFAAAGTYVVMIANALACDSLATLVLGLKPSPPAPILSSNSPICSGDILNLSAIANGADSYRWTGPFGFSSNQTNPVINNAALANRGSYSATITSDGCISPTASIIVDVVQRPIILASADKQIFEGDTAVLTPSIISSLSNLSFKWSPSIYFLSPDSIKTPQILGVTTTTYYLIVSAGNQCPSNAGPFVVKVLPKQKPFNIPNAFSPNGDGINDTWIINELNAYPDAQVQVYNRNGALVFNSIGYRKPWDGKYNGNVLPASTYYFVMVTKQGRNPISGWVSILK